MYKFLLSTIFLSILVLSSCSNEQPNALTESDVEAFLQRVELEDKTLGPIVSSAYWSDGARRVGAGRRRGAIAARVVCTVVVGCGVSARKNPKKQGEQLHSLETRPDVKPRCREAWAPRASDSDED